MTLTFLIDEGLELDDNSEDSDDTTEEQRPCIDPLCGWSRRQGCILFRGIQNEIQEFYASFPVKKIFLSNLGKFQNTALVTGNTNQKGAVEIKLEN